MTMDLNDVEYDAFLANDRTLDDPLVVRVERSGRARLRIINGAASSAFWIELGRLRGTLVAVDGNPVLPVVGSSFPIAIARKKGVTFINRVRKCKKTESRSKRWKPENLQPQA